MLFHGFPAIFDDTMKSHHPKNDLRILLVSQNGRTSILSHPQCLLNISKVSKSSKNPPGTRRIWAFPGLPPMAQPPSFSASAPPSCCRSSRRASRSSASSWSRGSRARSSWRRHHWWSPWRPMGTASENWDFWVGNSTWSYFMIFYAILTLSYFYNPDQIRFIFDSVMCIVFQKSQRPEKNRASDLPQFHVHPIYPLAKTHVE